MSEPNIIVSQSVSYIIVLFQDSLKYTIQVSSSDYLTLLATQLMSARVSLNRIFNRKISNIEVVCLGLTIFWQNNVDNTVLHFYVNIKRVTQ